MAFTIGNFWLANGHNMWVTYWFSPHGTKDDMGAQWMLANPLPFNTFPTPSGTTQLETSRFQKRVLYANGGTEWTYNALVENTAAPGWLPTWFNLEGGGNT
jgi:hypothetical protein